MHFSKAVFAISAILLSGAVQSVSAAPVNVAIIDSGVDYRHTALKRKMWTNVGEILNDGIDNDGNGKVDDFYGWNFAENDHKVIDYSYLGTFSNDPYRFFEIQLKSFNGTATQEEKAWVNSKRRDPNFIKEMNIFGNFVHGTHVAHIAARTGAQKIIAMKLIPTEVKQPFFDAQAALEQIDKNNPIGDILRDIVIKQLLDALAKQNGKTLEPIGQYTAETKARVANCSFGSSVPALKEVLKQLLPTLMGRELTDEELTAYAKYTINSMLANGSQFVVEAKDTFFVMAAGNDGTDNDDLPTFPANVKRRNAITVAATHGLTKLASFSNFGPTMVELAAPGVGIRAAIPGNEYLRVSGTSQAAPFVTNLIARMLETKSDLTFGEVKAILMATVDYKSFLRDKVASGGIANPERAVFAVRLMNSRSTMAEAIAAARRSVADMAESKSLVDGEEGIFLPLPSLIQ